MAGAQTFFANARKHRNDRGSNGKMQSGSRQRALPCHRPCHGRQCHPLLLSSILTSPHRLRYQSTSGSRRTAWLTLSESAQSASIVRVLSVGKSTPQPVAVRDRSRLRLLRRSTMRSSSRRRRRRRLISTRGIGGQGRGAPAPRSPWKPKSHQTQRDHCSALADVVAPRRKTSEGAPTMMPRR